MFIWKAIDPLSPGLHFTPVTYFSHWRQWNKDILEWEHSFTTFIHKCIRSQPPHHPWYALFVFLNNGEKKRENPEKGMKRKKNTSFSSITMTTMLGSSWICMNDMGIESMPTTVHNTQWGDVLGIFAERGRQHL